MIPKQQISLGQKITVLIKKACSSQFFGTHTIKRVAKIYHKSKLKAAVKQFFPTFSNLSTFEIFLFTRERNFTKRTDVSPAFSGRIKMIVCLKQSLYVSHKLYIKIYRNITTYLIFSYPTSLSHNGDFFFPGASFLVSVITYWRFDFPI